jgi:tetratricopeptide (TPR) repeat protein
VQVDGKNYLLPADADIPDERRVATRAVALDEVMTAMDAAASRASIIVIDACRDNPLPAGTGRNLARGLSVVGLKPKNSIVIYAAEAGSKALDGLFTPILANSLQQKGRSINQIMMSVRSEVYAKSSGQQTPGEYNQLFEELFLGERAGGDLVPEKIVEVTPTPKPVNSPTPKPSADVAPATTIGIRAPESAAKNIVADLESNNFKSAENKVYLLLDQFPDDPLALNLLGAIQIRKKYYSAAHISFKKSLSIDPHFFPAKYNFAELLLLEKKYPDAKRHFELIEAEGARQELLQFKIVLCNLQMDDYENANRVYKSMRNPGESPARYYAKAALENKRGNTSNAREQIEAARKFFVGKTGLFDESFKAVGINL